MKIRKKKKRNAYLSFMLVGILIFALLLFSSSILLTSSSIYDSSYDSSEVGNISFENLKSGEQTSNINLDIPEEFVAGFFNEISFESLNPETIIELYNMNSSYLWEYSEMEGWGGDMEYLNEEETIYSSDENIWYVQISINEEDMNDDTEDDWTLEINTHEETKTTELLVVKADTGASMIGQQLNFFFEPYQKGAQAEDSVSLRNDGNVDLTIEIEFESEDLQIVGDIESGDILEPGDTAEIVFLYETTTDDARPPIMIETISVTSYAMTQVNLDTDEDVRVYSRTSYGVETSYFVGYEGYEQWEDEGYSLQYDPSIDVIGNTYNEVTFYVYPNEEVYINFNEENITFENENVTIIPRDSDGSELEEIDFDPTEPLDSDYGEVEITVEFLSDREDDGFIELVVEEDRYTTEVQLTETAPEPGDEEVTFVEEQSETITLGIILIGGIVFIGAGRVWLSKRKGDQD